MRPNMRVMMSQPMNIARENESTAGINWMRCSHCATPGIASGAAVRAAVIIRKKIRDTAIRVILSSLFIQLRVVASLLRVQR